VSSGTEAAMSAIRVARAYTRRDKIIKFEGCYHGHADAFLVKAGSGALTLGIPTSPGVPAPVAADTLLARYNDLSSVDALLREHEGSVAAIIVEPIAGNMNLVVPSHNWLRALRAQCDRHGAVLIFDEVMTGFRVGPRGVQGLLGITPDLTTLGKVIGGGMPVGAFGGRRDIMEKIAPLGPVYQAGTLSGNPVAVAAGLTTLRHCTSEVYAHVDRVAAEVAGIVSGALTEAGVVHRLNVGGNLFSFFFTGTEVVDYASATTQDTRRYTALFHAFLDRGVYLPPSAYEAWFVSAAHDDEAVGHVLASVPDACRAAARGFATIDA
jgi:glutamate-1-semialdehyde 2,1-aminomutase